MSKLSEDPNRPYCHDCNRWMRQHRGLAESGLRRYTCSGCRRSTTGSAESTYNNQHLGYDPNMAKARA